MKTCKLCDNEIADKYTVCYECYKELERLRMKKDTKHKKHSKYEQRIHIRVEKSPRQ